ncbi:hypothetical protein JZ751_017132 [Albula glossodonta]|uniref:Uncharacterized protein n=1 Tax=Albula glossodonta TaxID=121402 RepID=A0A8T2NX58_9TELE|nr:hypothetical protein JZ751_017132 [Albula glossodonta]
MRSTFHGQASSPPTFITQAMVRQIPHIRNCVCSPTVMSVGLSLFLLPGAFQGPEGRPSVLNSDIPFTSYLGDGLSSCTDLTYLMRANHSSASELSLSVKTYVSPHQTGVSKRPFQLERNSHMTEINTEAERDRFIYGVEDNPKDQGSRSGRCLLGLTLLLLVCELITSRLCNSLINMVDSFHTLFILLRLSLPPLTPHRPAPGPSIGPSPSGSSVIPSPAPSAPPAPQPSPCPSVPPSSPIPPSSPTHTAASSLSRPYGWARVRPLGALISALLLAFLCISVSMEIFSHALWPHPTERPLLATLVGVVGLLFNTAVLASSHGELLEPAGGFSVPSNAWIRRLFSRLHAKSGEDEAQTGEGNPPGNEKDRNSFSISETVGGAIQDGAFVFCNPAASSVLDPDCHGKGGPHSPPPAPGPTPRNRTCEAWPHLKTSPQDPGICGKLDCGNHRHSNTSDEAPADSVHGGQGGSDPGVRAFPVVLGGTEKPGLIGSWGCSLPGLIMLVQALLGSVLVLANGLVLLQSDPDCLHSVGGCGPFVYLDPGFSALAVLVFLATTLPQACRYGSLLLQSAPPHLALEELSQRIAAVPGVLALHHLHVWQLTEVHLVASVHVHCRPGLGARGCADLLAGVTAVLRDVGVSCSTVQPEFLPIDLTATGISPAKGIPLLTPVPNCSLACGIECAGKMCCMPREEGLSLLPSAGNLEDVQPQVLIIENTYL